MFSDFLRIAFILALSVSSIIIHRSILIAVGVWLFVGKCENVRTMLETSRSGKNYESSINILLISTCYLAVLSHFISTGKWNTLIDEPLVIYANIVVQSNTHRTSEGIQWHFIELIKNLKNTPRDSFIGLGKGLSPLMIYTCQQVVIMDHI